MSGDLSPRGYMLPAKTSEWPTPPAFFQKWEQSHGPFTLDPCGQAEVHYSAWWIANRNGGMVFDGSTDALDGLGQSWPTGAVVWMNPPYGRTTSLWIKKAHDEIASGNVRRVVALLKSTTDVRWWHDYVNDCPFATVHFVKGRLYFGDGKAPAPFPSVVVVWEQAASRYESSGCLAALPN